MKKSTLTLLVLTFCLCACSGVISPTASDPASPPQTEPAFTKSAPLSINPSESVPAFPKSVATVSTPHIDQPPDAEFLPTTSASEGCGYKWAYHDIPELTSVLAAEVKKLDSEATAHVTTFGEDCTYTDGHADILVMETDFYIQQPVVDLTDFESFGNWIVQVMKLIEALPRESIPGAQTGFVEFVFHKSDSERVAVRIPIQTYRTEASGKNGEELFRVFYTNS